ncbi:Calx-beta domain-containing protein [Candidatus Palauibacter sp.]|uniref:Calx-beta domain-containing protein n=1 Tax=Candidatus Palauibacter sp. TaxID=3101350 RepID=UPI003B5284CC
MPQITVATSRDTLIVGLETLTITLTREAPLEDALTVTVRLTQEQNWLFDTSHDLTFSAGAAETGLALATNDFSTSVVESGDLTAVVDAVDGYDTGEATATVFVVSQAGPAVTVSLSQSSYVFEEDADSTAVVVTARMAAGVPRGARVFFSLSTEGRSDSIPELTAVGNVDYTDIAKTVRLEDWAMENGRWVARDSVAVMLLDDQIREGRERFRMRLEYAAGTIRAEIQLLNPDTTPCSGDGECRYLVFIDDDEDIPDLGLSVSADEISEEEEASSTATVSITNGKTFAADQTVTFAFGGTATEGTDYTVAPADGDDMTSDHQVIMLVDSTSVAVTLTAVDDDSVEGNETIEVSATLGGDTIGSTQTIRILEVLPKITLAASRDTIIAGLETLVLTATREAPLDAPVAVTLQVTQDENWLSRTSFRLNFAARGSRASVSLSRALFSSNVTESGSLTATIDSVTGYDTGDATETAYVVSQEGPAIKVSFADSSYRFGEDVSDPSVALVARAAAGMPRGASINFIVSARSGTAGSPGDYQAVSEAINLPEANFALTGGVWEARHELALTLVDDDSFEGTEAFSLILEMPPGHPGEVQLSDLEGARCQDNCATPVQITDDEDVPELGLSVSEEEIREEGETSSTATVSITNGKTFADDRILTFRLRGDAIAGYDYDVIPADADDIVEDHQVVLMAGSNAVGVTFTARDDDREEGDEEIRFRADHDGDVIGSGTIRLIDRFPGPRVEITFEGVEPPRDEYTAGVATGPFTARFTFSERVEGFAQEDIRWQTQSRTTIDTTTIAVLVWDYAVIREGLEYTVKAMPDQDGQLWGIVHRGAARSVATSDGNQPGANSLLVDLPPDRLMVAPAELTIDEGDEDGAHFLVVPTSAPTSEVTVTVTGTDGTDLEVDWSTWTFGLPYWNGGWGVTVTAAHDADTSNERVGLWVRASGGGYDGRGADLVVNIRDDDASSADRSGDDGPQQDGLAEALDLLGDVTPEVAAAALLGETRLGKAQLNALDRLGNRNGRYDLGDMLSWAARCRRAERSNSPRRRRLHSHPRGRRQYRRGRKRWRRAPTALACLALLTLTWGCDGRPGLMEAATAEPAPGFLSVELAAPAGARLGGVWLAVEGPDIASLRAPGLEVFESEAETADGGIRREVIVAGTLSEGRILEFQVPDRGLAGLYRVHLIEITGEDFTPRDLSAYSGRISR